MKRLQRCNPNTIKSRDEKSESDYYLVVFFAPSSSYFVTYRLCISSPLNNPRILPTLTHASLFYTHRYQSLHNLSRPSTYIYIYIYLHSFSYVSQHFRLFKDFFLFSARAFGLFSFVISYRGREFYSYYRVVPNGAAFYRV